MTRSTNLIGRDADVDSDLSILRSLDDLDDLPEYDIDEDEEEAAAASTQG